MGPDLFVLGEFARDNGLGASLLHRLTRLYEAVPDATNHSMMLSVNYRSHVVLFQFSSRLFYDGIGLCTSTNVKSPPNGQYPLKFICSDLKNRIGELEPTNHCEVQVILSEIDKLNDPSNCCIMATNSRQVCTT